MLQQDITLNADQPKSVFLLRTQDSVLSMQFESFLIENFLKYDIAGKVFQSKKTNTTYYEVAVILKTSTTKSLLQTDVNRFLERNDLEENGYILASFFSSRKGSFKPAFEKQALLALNNTTSATTAKVSKVKSAAVSVAVKKKDLKKKKELFAQFLESHPTVVDELSGEEDEMIIETSEKNDLEEAD